MTTPLSDADRAAIAAAKSSKGHAVGAYTQDERIYRAGLTAGRATALEEAAKVCEAQQRNAKPSKWIQMTNHAIHQATCRCCAAAIRAAKG